MSENQSGLKPAPDPRSAQIVAGAILLATVIYPVISVVLLKSGVVPEGGLAEMAPGVERIFAVLLGMIAVSMGVLSFVLKRMLIARAAQNPNINRLSVVIVSMAMAEAGGVMGLVYVLLIGDLAVAGLLFGISFAAALAHFPGRAWLEGR